MNRRDLLKLVPAAILTPLAIPATVRPDTLVRLPTGQEIAAFDHATALGPFGGGIQIFGISGAMLDTSAGPIALPPIRFSHSKYVTSADTVNIAAAWHAEYVGRWVGTRAALESPPPHFHISTKKERERR